MSIVDTITRAGPKKIILTLLGFIASIMFIVWSWGFFHTGKLVVITAQKNSVITLNDQFGKQILQVNGSLKQSLRSGTYSVVVSSDSQTVKQTANVLARKTTTYNLVPPSFTNAEPVTGSAGQNIVTDANRMRYLSRDLNRVISLDSAGNVNYSSDSVGLDSIKWADTGYGIGQTESGALFVIEDSDISPLVTKNLSLTGEGSVGYAVLPDHEVFITLNGSLYRGKVGGTFSKIFSTNASSLNIVPGGDYLALLESSTVGHESAEIESRLTILDKNGKKISSKSIDASDDLNNSVQIAWSPDNTKLVVGNSGGHSIVYNRLLERVSILPDTSIASVVWLNNEEVLYSTSNVVWSFNPKNGQSSNIAQISNGSTIYEITVSKDKSYVYASSTMSDGGAIYRFGLHNQRISDTAYKIGIFLPLNTTTCTADFFNFSKLIIGLYRYAESQDTACKSEVVSEIQNDQLNPADFIYVNGPLLSQSD